MAFTRKKRKTTRRTTRKRNVRRKSRKVFRRTKKRNPLAKVVMRVRRHPVLDRGQDRDHIYVTQTYNGIFSGTPVQNASTLGQSTDGFLISMNQVVSTFQGLGIGSTQYGVPISINTLTPPGGNLATQGASSGSVNPGLTSYVPDGFTQFSNRYKQWCVTSGVFDIKMSQDSTQAAGSTRLAVCGFPASAAPDFLQALGAGHYIYPNAVGVTLSRDSQSFDGLLAEPNCRKSIMTPFAGSKTMCHIRYPFSMNKYSPPGYWTSGQFFGDGVQAAGFPTLAFQPRILVQMHNDGISPNSYRLEMKMTWRLTGFERYPVISVL